MAAPPLLLDETLDPAIAELRADLGWLELLPFSARHAFFAGEIEATLEEQGVPRDRLNALGGDILVGGVARAENATVVTEHLDEFELLTGVDVEGY